MVTDLRLFAAGFACSAVGSFWLVAVTVGAWTDRVLAPSTRAAALAAVLGTLLVADVVRWRQGQACSIGPRRQTPRHWGASPTGVLLWGVDTGVPVTTVRATALPLAALAATALGAGGPATGAAYAAGFIGALVALTRVPRPRTVTAIDDVDAVHDALLATRGVARVAGVLALGAAAAVVAPIP